MLTIWGFDYVEDKHTLFRRKDCMKKFCTPSREHAKNIIDFEKKEMIILPKEELKLYQDAKVCIICRKKKFTKDKNYQRVRDYCHYTGKYRGAAHSICNLKFNVLNKIPTILHNGSNYDYDLWLLLKNYNYY